MTCGAIMTSRVRQWTSLLQNGREKSIETSDDQSINNKNNESTIKTKYA